jgi:Family of unknown function (DUF6459)
MPLPPPTSSGEPPGTSGNPPGTSGNPPGTSGNPPGTSGKPSGTSGKPPGTSGKPPGADSGSAGGAVLPLVPGFGRPARRRPLPDATAVRLLPVPDSAPPYDDGPDEVGPGRRPLPPALPRGRLGPAARPKLAGTTTPKGPRRSSSPAAPTQPRPPAVSGRSSPPAAPGQPPLAAVPGQPSLPAVPGQPSLPATARGTAADARWPSQFAQVLAETLAGSRSQGQIRPWTTDQARRRIRQLGPSLAAGVQPRIRRIITSRPATGVVEMTVIVGFGPRVRALAVRLEREAKPGPSGPGRDGPPEPGAAAARWICTAVEAA